MQHRLLCSNSIAVHPIAHELPSLLSVCHTLSCHKLCHVFRSATNMMNDVVEAHDYSFSWWRLLWLKRCTVTIYWATWSAQHITTDMLMIWHCNMTRCALTLLVTNTPNFMILHVTIFLMTIHCKWRNCYTVSRHQLTFVRLTVMSQKQHITFSVCQWADDIMVIRNMASLCATPGWLNMHCTTLHSCTVVTLPESSNGPVSVTVTNSVSVCPLLTPNDRATGHPVKVGSWLGLHSVMTSHTHTPYQATQLGHTLW